MPEDRTAATLAESMSAKVPEIPEILRRSLTWDQGSEMALHTEITEATGLPIYFCDPHSPWQRGTNENTYWYTVLVPGRFDGSQPVGCWVTRRTRVADGFPLICPRQLRARALTGSDLIEAC